jgi:hypothetical protein
VAQREVGHRRRCTAATTRCTAAWVCCNLRCAALRCAATVWM